MNREAARVADIGDVVEELQGVDEFAPRFDAALQLKADQGAVAAGKNLLGDLVVAEAGQAGLVHPVHVVEA